MKLDDRLNAFREDLADSKLKGAVNASEFVDAKTFFVSKPIVDVVKEPNDQLSSETQFIFNEPVYVFEIKKEFSWVQALNDHYVGYVKSSSLMEVAHEATLKVKVLSSPLFSKPSYKSSISHFLYFGSNVEIIETNDKFSLVRDLGWIFTDHLIDSTDYETSHLSVAMRFLEAPYVWGGKTVQGIDCSGLVQLSLNAVGLDCPRDSDMIEKNLSGLRLNDTQRTLAGDIICWPGHVAIAVNEFQAINATAHHMRVVIEDIKSITSRVETGAKVTRIRPTITGFESNLQKI